MDRIRHSEPDTTQLIQRLANVKLDNGLLSPTKPIDDQSTTALLNTDLGNHNVSQSTMLIHGTIPVTPERRPISGSSLNLLDHDFEIDTNGDHELNNNDGDDPDDDDDEHKHKDYDINIDHFNLLLTKLPSSVEVLHFITILSNYIQSLQQHKIDISTDRFIITIYNQLRLSNFQLRNNDKMNKIIDIFVNHPTNEAMKLSNFLYFSQVHNKKKLYLKLWLIKFRKFKEIEKSEKVWELYIKKKYFNKLMNKYDAYSNELASNALIFNDIKKTLKFFEIWKMKSEKIKNLSEIVELHRQSKVFNLWTDKINEDYSNAFQFREQVLLQKSIRQWKLKKVANNETFNTSKLSIYFQKWKLRQNEIRNLKEESKVLELVLSGGYFFTKWKDITLQSKAKEDELISKYEKLIIKKYLKIWNYSRTLKSVEHEVNVFQNRSKLIATLRIWKQRKLETEQCRDFQYKNQHKMKELVFDNWKTQLKLNETIDTFASKNLLKKYLKIWKLNTVERLNKHDNKFDNLIISKSFNHWFKIIELKTSLNSYNQTILKDQFILWKAKTDENQSMLKLSEEANESFVKLRFLQFWHNRYKLNEQDLNNRLVFFLKKKTFNEIKTKFEKLSNMRIKADDYFHVKSANLIKLNVLNQWHSKYLTSIEIKLSNKLEIYKVEKAINTKRKFFDKWKNKNDLYLNQLDVFKTDHLQELVLPKFIQTWKSKLIYIKDMDDVANETNQMNLLSSGFNKLQIKLIQLRELQNLSMVYQQDFELKIILKYLNLWSLKLLKAKRDYENIKSFRNRWDRAHLRAILLLWKGKLNDVVSYEDIEYSPTVFRTNAFNQLSGNISQHHVTPIKLNKSVTTSEYNDNVSIPGSERIKRQRYEALKSRYNRIKYAIPSPLKRTDNNNNSNKTPIDNKDVIEKVKFDKAIIRSGFESTSSKKLKFVPDGLISPITSNKEKEQEINYDDDSEFEDPISSPIISHTSLFNYGSARK